MDRLELRQALCHSSGSREGRQRLSSLPPHSWQATPLAAAHQNVATAQGQVPTLSTLSAATSMCSPRGRAAVVGATTSSLPVYVPCLQGNRQHQDTAPRAEGWQADLQVPEPPLKPANETPKYLRLAYWRRPVATRSGRCQKPAMCYHQHCENTGMNNPGAGPQGWEWPQGSDMTGSQCSGGHQKC